MLDAQNVGIQVTCSKYGGATAISYSHSGLDLSSEPPGKAFRPAGQRPQLKRCPPSVLTFTGRNDILAQSGSVSPMMIHEINACFSCMGLEIGRAHV